MPTIQAKGKRYSNENMLSHTIHYLAYTYQHTDPAIVPPSSSLHDSYQKRDVMHSVLKDQLYEKTFIFLRTIKMVN